MDLIEIENELRSVIGMVADDNFEGWPSYHEDAEKVLEEIMILLQNWVKDSMVRSS